jgi:hypothetical protein
MPVWLTGRRSSVSEGRMLNLSLSGAWIEAEFDLRVLDRIQVCVESERWPKHEAPVISAYVARACRDAVGVEWCEFAPRAVSELLRFAANPNAHVHVAPIVLTPVTHEPVRLIKFGS